MLEPKVLETGNSSPNETTYENSGTSEATEVNAPKTLSSTESTNFTVNAGQSVAEAETNNESKELSTSEDSLQTERGESGSSEAVVGTTARESTQNESQGQNINQTDVKAVVNSSARALKVSTDNKGVRYVHVVSKNTGFERSTSEKKAITNTILVNEVKKLIKELGGGSGGVHYVAGTGIVISDNIISIDSSVVATQTQLQNVREVAEGKCKAVVINTQSDITGTKDADGNYTGVTAITGVSDLSILKIGDVILIKELDVPDYWVSALVYDGTSLESISLNKMETSKIDLSVYAQKSQNETITGQYTFTSPIYLTNSNFHIEKNADSNVVDITVNGTKVLTLGSSSTAINSVFRANTDNDKDLGQTNVRWKDLYLSGSIKDGTNSVAVEKIATTDTAQDITGTKTVTLPFKLKFGNYVYKFDDANFGQIYLGRDSVNAGIVLDGGTLRADGIAPSQNNARDIGTSGLKWKNLYLSGNLSDGINSVSIADLAALITYAKGQGWIQ